MEKQNIKSCLITGGSGFIGTHLVEELLREGHFSRIYILDIREPSFVRSNVEYIACDINSPIVSLTLKKCDTCYHLAAICKEPGHDWNEYFITNYEGTRNVCDLADRLGIKNMIFISTMMVFRAGEERNNEEALTAPDTAYGISKMLAELVFREWLAKSPERRLRIVRPGVVFGKGESANYTKLYYALKKKRFAYIGRKNTIKGSIYVKDLVRFIYGVTCDANDRITYNLVYPEPITIEEICMAMCEVFGFSRRIPVVPYKIALLASYIMEILASIGVKTSIHHRRIEKLYYSTNISACPAMETGFHVRYPLVRALKDWQNDCWPKDLY